MLFRSTCAACLWQRLVTESPVPFSLSSSYVSGPLDLLETGGAGERRRDQREQDKGMGRTKR